MDRLHLFAYLDLPPIPSTRVADDGEADGAVFQGQLERGGSENLVLGRARAGEGCGEYDNRERKGDASGDSVHSSHFPPSGGAAFVRTSTMFWATESTRRRSRPTNR